MSLPDVIPLLQQSLGHVTLHHNFRVEDDQVLTLARNYLLRRWQKGRQAYAWSPAHDAIFDLVAHLHFYQWLVAMTEAVAVQAMYLDPSSQPD